jgi:hypothetical protein
MFFRVESYRSYEDLKSAKHDREQDKPNTLVRLVAGFDGMGKIYCKLTYATPDTDFLKANGLSFETFTLADVGDLYSGRICYYTLDGESMNGFILSDGKVHSTLSSGKHTPQSHDIELYGGAGVILH